MDYTFFQNYRYYVILAKIKIQSLYSNITIVFKFVFLLTLTKIDKHQLV